MGLVEKRSKNFYENAVGELKVCKIETPQSSIRQYFNVCRPPSKWEVETPIYSENEPNKS